MSAIHNIRPHIQPTEPNASTSSTNSNQQTTVEKTRKRVRSISSDENLSPNISRAVLIEKVKFNVNAQILNTSDKIQRVKRRKIEAKDSNYSHNVDIISHFPGPVSEKEKQPRIKAWSGRLDLASAGEAEGWFGSLCAKATQFRDSLRGTQLPETVIVIEKVIKTAQSEFDIAVESVEEKNSAKEKLKALEVLASNFETEVKLFNGLNPIKYSYHMQAPNGRRDDGLDELNELYTFAENNLNNHRHILESFQTFNSTAVSKALKLPVQNYAKHIDKHTQDLTAYCKVHCSARMYEEAIAFIQQGQDLMKRILKDEVSSLSKNTRKSHQEMTQIVWFLMYYALQKGQGFNQGSFIIEEEGKLFDFIEALGIRRECSHFTNRPHDKWYEIDVINGLMPAQKKIVLFGFVSVFSQKEKVLFFKPEDASGAIPSHLMAIPDLIAHTVSYFESKINKTFLLGADDLPAMQKERIPYNLLVVLKKLIEHLQEEKNIDLYHPILHKLLITDPNVVLQSARTWGVAYIHHFVTAFYQELQSSPHFNDTGTLHEFNKIMRDINEILINFDNLEHRVGREVYINKTQLRDFVERPLHFDSRDRLPRT